MTAGPVPFVRRPARLSGLIAVAAGTAAVWLVADTGLQREALGVAIGGIAIFAIGVSRTRRDRQWVGLPVAIVGCIVGLAAIYLAAMRPSMLVHRFEVLPGLVGLWILAAGELPVRAGWERRLVAVGTALVFASVLVSGVVRGPSLTGLLAAGALSVIAWDVGENAVSLGRQLGGDAATVRAEITHVAASGAVAVTALLLSLGVHRLGVTDLPFATLAALLAAGIVLTLVHHR